MSTFQTAGRYVAVETRDSLAFFASNWGLEIFSIADPTSPVRLSSTPTAGIATDLETDGRFVYLADSGHALLVFDCIDPAAPSLIAVDSLGLLDRAYPMIGDLLLVDTILYVAIPHSDSGVYIFNVSDPTSPQLAAIFKCPCYPDTPLVPSFNPQKFCRIDSLLYVFDYYGVWVADISDPGHPLALGSYRLTGPGYWEPKNVAGAGDRLFMHESIFLHQFDVSDPSSPVPTTFQIPEGLNAPLIQDLYVQDSFLIMAAYADGLKIALIPSTPTDSLEIGALLETPGNARAVTCSNGVLIVADGDGGFETASGTLPVMDSIGYYPNGSYLADIARLGPYFITQRRPRGQGGGLYLFEAADPRTPHVVDSILIDHDVRFIAVKGDRLYAMEFGDTSSAFHTRLLVLDASEPRQPVLLGSYVSPYDSLGVSSALGIRFATDGHYTYHADKVFSVVDVSRPDSMYMAGRVPGSFSRPGGTPVLGQAEAFAVYGSYLYAFDISNPADPDVINPSGALLLTHSDAILRDTLLYQATNSGFRVISVANPLNMYQVGSLSSRYAFSGLIAVGSWFLVAQGLGGIAVIDATDPTDPTEVATYNTPGSALALVADDSMAYVADGCGLTVVQHGLSTDIRSTENGTLPTIADLGQNYPNPFNAGTSFAYSVGQPTPAALSIFNVLGQKVYGIELGVLPAGTHRISWNGITTEGKPAPSGIYFYRMGTGYTALTRRMLLLR